MFAVVSWPAISSVIPIDTSSATVSGLPLLLGRG